MVKQGSPDPNPQGQFSERPELQILAGYETRKNDCSMSPSLEKTVRLDASIEYMAHTCVNLL